MFKLRYNVLIIIQVLIGLLNYIFMIKIFGASKASDAFFISIAILTAFELIQLFPIEQFMFFYNDIKTSSLMKAHTFYNATLTISIITGVVSFILFYCFGETIYLIFLNVDSDHELVDKLVNIIAFELLFFPTLTINQKLLNAEMKFAIPYILNFLPSLSMFFATIYLYINRVDDISLIIYSKVCGVIFSYILSFHYIHKYFSISINLTLRNQNLKKFIQNSISMRLGHNIHNFFVIPITTNFLTILPIGYVSHYYYAQKIVSIIYSVIMGPTFNIFQANLSKFWSSNDYKNTINLIRKYILSSLPIFIIFCFVAYIFLPDMLLILNKQLTEQDIYDIKHIFLGLVIWQTIIVLESGYVSLLINDKQSQIFIFANTIFTIIYFLISYLLLKNYRIDAILIGLISGQLFNLFIYTYHGSHLQIPTNNP